MTGILLWIMTALYFAQSIICAMKGQIGQSIILCGYVVANIGLTILVGR